MEHKDGEFAVKFAREVIEKWVKTEKRPDVPKVSGIFNEKSGVFATIYEYPSKHLRGCIGLPYPNKKLIDAIMEAAISVTGDSRFPTLSNDELDKVTVEVSILTKPEKIVVKDPKEYLKEVNIGIDGLIIQNGYQYGLLLPQVPLEQKWDVKEYLEHLCMKAGMPIDAWEYEGSELFRFRSDIYAEEKPNGKIVKLDH